MRSQRTGSIRNTRCVVGANSCSASSINQQIILRKLSSEVYCVNTSLLAVDPYFCRLRITSESLMMICVEWIGSSWIFLASMFTHDRRLYILHSKRCRPTFDQSWQIGCESLGIVSSAIIVIDNVPHGKQRSVMNCDFCAQPHSKHNSCADRSILGAWPRIFLDKLTKWIETHSRFRE